MPTYSAGDSAPAGPYACMSCDNAITLESGQSLPTCSSCGGTTWQPSGGRAVVSDPKPVGSI